jgi:NitT/TauT family transport system substrate-binding protein
MMIDKGGFAAKQGLKLEIIQFKNDVIALQALVAGDIDSFDGGPSSGIVAAARGADVKVIGCEWPGVPYGIFVKKDINAITDLKGKTMAISSPGAAPDVVAHFVLAKFGVPLDSVRFANLGADLDRFKSVVAGIADATVVSNEYTPIAEQQGVKMLLRAQDVVPNYMRICLFTSGKALADRREDAVKFMAAEMSSLHYGLTHRDEVLALTRATIGAKPEDPRPAFIYDDAVKSHAIDPDIALPVDKLKWLTDQLVASGVLPRPYDVAKMADPGVRELALARLKQ